MVVKSQNADSTEALTTYKQDFFFLSKIEKSLQDKMPKTPMHEAGSLIKTTRKRHHFSNAHFHKTPQQ
ncbi:hypothetical protein GE061_008053 [Apolygus lucorum]|uniref:Uncharacterized protein n=1 Tax=Apolygus lucorum TaxID=248454 RepID=A0A8S9WSD4_APOLU|nr:hypothetical protein GE061_008053 [Apolygus lucorum]